MAENRPLDCIRAWYLEALEVYDAVWRIFGGDKADANRAITGLLYSTTGRTGMNRFPSDASIVDALNELLGSDPARQDVFDMIAQTVMSGYAATKVLPSLFANETMRSSALRYLRTKQVHVPEVTIQLADFIRLWDILRKMTERKSKQTLSTLKSLASIELFEAQLEDAVSALNHLKQDAFLSLDGHRLGLTGEAMELAVSSCKKAAFEDRERLFIQIDNDARDLISEIERGPTRLSVEGILPIVENLLTRTSNALQALYETSAPDISLGFPLDAYIPDDSSGLRVQVVVRNSMGRSPAEDLGLVPLQDEVYYLMKGHDMRIHGSLRGGEQQVLELPMSVTDKAVASKAFALRVCAQYRTRSGNLAQTATSNFPVKLLEKDKFQRIDNPYASYAEGGIVSDPAMFYGREELLRNILSSMESSRTQGKCVILFGQKRSGKSSILYHIKTRLQATKSFLVIDLGNIGMYLDYKVDFRYQMLWAILSGLQTAIIDLEGAGYPRLNLEFPRSSEFYKHASPFVLFKEVMDAYTRQSSATGLWKRLRSVVLIDEFSYLYGHIITGRIPSEFMQNWKALLQSGYFNAILAGQDVMPKFKLRFANEFGTTQDERVTYLKEEDARALIEEPIRISGRRPESRYREKAVDAILNLTAGSPFYIQMVCNRLVEYMNRNRMNHVTEIDVERVKDDMITGVNPLSLDKFDNLVSSGDISDNAISTQDALRVLRAVALHSQAGLCSRPQIACDTSAEVDEVLDDLVKRDVLECFGNRDYRIRVGLFSEWLRLRGG